MAWKKAMVFLKRSFVGRMISESFPCPSEFVAMAIEHGQFVDDLSVIYIFFFKPWFTIINLI